MEYKITFKNQMRALRPLISGAVVFGIAIYFLAKNKGYDFCLDYLLIGYGGFFVWVSPALFVHIEYYFINRKDIVEINAEQKLILFNNRPAVAFRNIEKITLVMSFVLYRNDTVKFTPWDSYHYALIKMKDGKKFFFTNLMVYKIEDTMQEISEAPIEKARRFIASPQLLRWWYAFWKQDD
jgi:hypothetical protein